MKKIVALGVCGVMLSVPFALAACGSGGGSNVEEGATEIVVYLQDFEAWENSHTETMIEEFNSILDDGIQLVPRFFQDDAYPDALSSARANNAAPDIFMCSYGNLYGTVVAHDYAAPLNGLMQQEYLDDINDTVKPMVTFKDNEGADKIYAYPQLTEASALLFYRKDAFAAAGITSAPKSWAELLETCSKVKGTLGKGQYTLGVPIGAALGWATYGLQYNAAGSVALSDDWMECKVDCDGYRALAGLWYDLYKGGYVPAGSMTARGYNDIIEALCLGKLAMTFGGSWSIGTIMHSYPEMKDEIGVAPLPTLSGKSGEVTASNGGWTYCISSTSKHKELAAKVLEWFYAEDAARTARYFENAYYSKSPATKSVQAYIESSAPDDLRDWLNVVTDVCSLAIPEPTYSWEISTAVSGMLESVALNSNQNKDTLIEREISSCKSKIERMMEIQGKNPAYKG